jgi:hypothetical protein
MHEISIVFSSHRPEALTLAAPLMDRHDAIFLEEPPTQGFRSLLDETLAVEDYLSGIDTEFPEYSRQTCQLLQHLHGRRKAIFQVEPYLELLAGIHEIFENGGRPSDLDPASKQFTVHQAEKRATGALLRYYETVVGGSFEATLETVKAFAEADAARFLLRDSLRAEALAQEVLEHPRAYVEAGTIHYALWSELGRILKNQRRPKAVFLMAPVVKPLLGKRQALGPGDVLTLQCLFGPRARGARMDLLAARSLVFVSLLENEEIVPGEDAFPHTRGEVRAIRMVERLTIDDCKRVFPEVRASGTRGARAVVQDYLDRRSKR